MQRAEEQSSNRLLPAGYTGGYPFSSSSGWISILLIQYIPDEK